MNDELLAFSKQILSSFLSSDRKRMEVFRKVAWDQAFKGNDDPDAFKKRMVLEAVDEARTYLSFLKVEVEK